MIQDKDAALSGENMTEPAKAGRKKAVFPRQRRKAWAVAGGMILLLAAVGLVLCLLPAKDSVENTLYSYQVTTDSAYRVHLIPNELYGSEWLEEEKVYPEALSDSIEFHLKAFLQGDGPAVVAGSYQVTAILEGYQSSTEGSQSVYEKQFLLKDGKISGTDDGQAAVDETFQIQLSQYRQLAEQADQILQTKVARAFTLSFTGTFTMDTSFGQKQQDFTYQITLPIGSGTALYEITKPDPVSKEGKITETRQVDRPVNTGRILLLSLAGTAGLFLLLFPFFFTRLPNEEETWRAEMKRIIRKYGARMTRLEQLPDLGRKECVHVADIDSMVSMAEEIRRPLFYCPDEEQLPRDGVFCISGPEQLYLLEIKRPSTTLVVDANAEGGK